MPLYLLPLIRFASTRDSALSEACACLNAVRRQTCLARRVCRLDRSSFLAPSPTTAYLVLAVAGLRCALAQAEVREILPLPHLHRPPAAGPILAGFADLGGLPVPVIDLPRLLGLRPAAPAPQDDDPYRHLVLSARSDTALLVDRVEDLVQVPAEAVRPVSGAHTLNGCVVAELVWGEGLVPVLAMDLILTADERERLSVLAARQAERLAALPIA